MRRTSKKRNGFHPEQRCAQAGQRTIAEQGWRKAGISGGRLPREERKGLLNLLKAMPLTIIHHGSLEKATVTSGGVDGKEIDFKTMQSRLCPGLFFAGEVLDVDGPCGGYNLQIAFSTGALAGRSAARYIRP